MLEKLNVKEELSRFNKLDINLSKTFFMFVTNKIVKLPKKIIANSIKVSDVTSFKLLGITIDKNLTFSEHCSNIKKIVKH